MTQPASPGSPEQRMRDEPTPERRRLLKAAAAAAPLIATLPSGAARAMSSTSQCIIQDRAKCQIDQTVDGAVALLDYDGYARELGFAYVFSNGTNDVTVYQVPALGSQYYFGSSGTLANGTEYTIGEVFSPSGGDATGGYDWSQTSGPQQVLLLRLYRAESDTGDALDNPTGVTTCSPGTTDTGSTCLFPVSQIGSPDELNQNPGNNTGLTTSCLTSFDPDGTNITPMV